MSPFDISRFCSVGTDCEFGIVQFKLGYEDNDLLRYARTPADSLVSLLRGGFEPLLDPASLWAEHDPDGHFIVHNDALGMWWHGFTREHDVLAYDIPRRREQAAKLCREVQTGSRIFVRKSLADTPGQAWAIAVSVGAPMLWVTQDPARHGEIERDGRMWHGYLRALQQLPTHDNIDVEGWTELLGRAWPLMSASLALPACAAA